MDFEIRPLVESDYEDTLVGWWKDWRWIPPIRDFLPNNGCGGIMVLDDNIPVCAGFLYTTNSGVAWVEFIVSDRNYKIKGNRSIALHLLVDTLTNIAKNMEFAYCYTLINNKSLIGVYSKLGYIKSSENSVEMIKKL